MAQQKFDFLTEYVIELLKVNGFGDLDQQQMNVYVPALLERVQERIGAEMLPQLSEADQNKFAEMVQDTASDAAAWKAFWYRAVPNFEDQLRAILAVFTEDMKQILQSQSV